MKFRQFCVVFRACWAREHRSRTARPNRLFLLQRLQWKTRVCSRTSCRRSPKETGITVHVLAQERVRRFKQRRATMPIWF